MRENRKYLRVNFLNTGWLHHNECKYFCRLDNISRNGALVRLRKLPGEPFCPGDNCCLKLYMEEEGELYHNVEARVVRYEPEEVALEFIESGIESLDKLDNIIRKEFHFIDGGQKIIDQSLEIAELKGMELTVAYFDKGTLNPEREIHSLRLSDGGNSVNVHLNREEIEAFSAEKDSKHVKAKIFDAIERLNV